MLASYYAQQLHALVSQHFDETRSPRAEELLLDWENALQDFVQIVPKEMLSRLSHPLDDNAARIPAQ